MAIERGAKTPCFLETRHAVLILYKWRKKKFLDVVGWLARCPWHEFKCREDVE